MPDEGALIMNHINVDRLMEELSAILSEKYGAEITIRAVPKEDASGSCEKCDF